jgi:hypothetical protein
MAATLSLLAMLALSGTVLAAETVLNATLAGDASTDADGTGTAKVTLDPAAGTACWDLSVSNIAAVTQSHIHIGAAGASGDVVVPLDVDGFTGTSTGCTTGVAAATLQAVIDNPAGYYVNVHNADFPGGAIRGQLAAAVPTTALPMADGSTALLGAVLLALALATGLRAWRPLVTRD